MSLKKHFTFLLILLISFGVMGVVSADTTITLTNPSDEGTAFSGMETITWDWDGTNPSSGWSIYIYWGPSQVNSETVLPYIGGSARSWSSFDTTEYDDGTDYYVEIVNNDNPAAYHDMSDNAFTIDNNAPEIGTVTISPSYSDGTTYVSITSDISASIEDNGGSGVDSCEYTLDGSTWTSATYSAGTCGAENIDTSSASSINIRATDYAENTGTGTAVSVTLDNSEPTVSITSPTTNNIVDATFDLIISSSDTGSEVQNCWYTIDSDSTQNPLTWCDDTNSVTLSVSDGHHTINVYVEDGVDLGASDSVEIILDTDNTLTICDSGCDFTEIQAAIDAADSGDTIDVAVGTYTESITVDEELLIIGSGDTTIIQPVEDADGIVITANNVLIKDLKIVTSNSGGATPVPNIAIAIKETNNVEINNVVIETTGNTAMGIWVGGSSNGLSPSSNLEIIKSQITINDVATGIYAAHSNPAHSGWIVGGSSVNANTVTTNNGLVIELYDVSNSVVSYNALTTSSSGGAALIWSSELSDISNLIFNNNVVDGSGGSQVAFLTDFPWPSDTTDTTVTTVTISENTFTNWDSRALRIGDGVTSVTANNNQFLSVGEALRNEDASEVDAQNNYWGTAVYADISSKIDGNVDFEPYYINSAMTMLSDTVPTTVYVDDDYIEGSAGGHYFGYDAFSTISSGISAVASDGTVNVAAGTYNEEVVIDKGVTLVGDIGDGAAGSGSSAPVLDGLSTLNDAFTLSAGVSDVTIKGFEIANYVGSSSGVGNAIQAWNSGTSNIEISDNYMHHLDWNGVLVGNDGATGDHDNWVIKNNILEYYDAYGLELTNARNSVIEDNIVTASNSWTGIVIVARRDEFNITIQNNKISGAIDSEADGRAAIYVLAWDVETPDLNLNGVDIKNNEITTTGTKPHIRFLDVGTGEVLNAVVNNNILSSLTNNAVAEVNAEDNWWGTTDGTTISGLVSANVDYTPWAYNSNVDTDGEIPTVVTITITPKSGDYISGNSDIGSSIGDSGGSGVASCEYTLDGSSWVAGIVNGGNCEAIDVDTSTATSINMRVTDNSGNVGTGSAVSVTPDTTAPTTTDSGTDINWHGTDVVVTLTPTDGGSDVANTYYCVDQLDSCPPTTSGTSVIVSTEGTNYVRYYSVDNVGNEETIKTATNIVKIDTTAPSFDLITPEDKTIEIGDGVTITATVTDTGGSSVANVELYLDDVDSGDLTSLGGNEWSLEITNIEETTTYYLMAYDEAGKIQTSSTYTITVNDLIWELDSTWNLVSSPKVTAQDMTGLGSRFGYDNGWVSDPTTIEAGMGYWISNNDDFGLDYTSDCTVPQCLPSGKINIDALNNGWNLIGLTTTDPSVPVEDAFGSMIYDDTNLPVYYVASYNGNDFELMESGGSEMTPGEGYWVYVVQ